MLAEKLKKYHLILASGSPRRQNFFKELDLDYEIRLKEIEEDYPHHLKGSEITDYLSKLKAESFVNELNENDILITADTIVWLDGKAIGKPQNKQESIKILQKLSNKTHQVISSFCITSASNQIVENDTTFVTFSELNDSEINYYINNFKPFDKAGSYGIQEWIGYIGIEKIEGSYFNVMGFPIQKFYQSILKFIC